jgi:hypothetical protein
VVIKNVVYIFLIAWKGSVAGWADHAIWHELNCFDWYKMKK